MNIKEMYDQTPDWVKTGLWIGFSAGVTALISSLLEVPELMPYYGVLNFALFAIKEINKQRTKKE